MKYFYVFFLFQIMAFQVLAQKKIIDSSVFNKWPSVENAAISSDGKYISYSIDKIPLGSQTVVIQATDNKWRKEIIGASEVHFTQDANKVLYKLTGDSLCICQLGTEQCVYYQHVLTYQLAMVQEKECLVIQWKDYLKILNLQYLPGIALKTIGNVKGYAISANGKSLLVETQKSSGEQTINGVEWFNLNHGDSLILWGSTNTSEVTYNVGNFVFDNTGEQATFTVSEQKNGKSENSLWYYKAGMEQAVEKVNSQTVAVLQGSEIWSGKFTVDGSRYLFSLAKRGTPSPEKLGVMVDIWSYTDDKLQAQQLEEAKGSIIVYRLALNLDNNKVVLLQGENEKLFDNKSSTDDYMLLTTIPCNRLENYWRSSCRVSLYLVNTRDGSRQLVKEGLISGNWSCISPDGKYVLFYDHEQQAFFSYSINTGKSVNISHNIPFPVSNNAMARAGLPDPYNLPIKISMGNAGLIVYDEYDIWQVDPAGIHSPVCLTKEYGRANGIVLRLAADPVTTWEKVLLHAFRLSDKANGFYQLDLTSRASPKLLTMDPYLYKVPSTTGFILKAANANTWLVKRMSASNAPDYFVTSNFKSFQRLSHVQPQKEYNWLTAELHEWMQFDGRKSQGILYKPENFDPSKRYPVIFHFYEKKSDELNEYLKPDAIAGPINIPHFVSNGYLIFVPDIHYIIGEPAESIYNSVVSAARYVSQMPFVDSTKIGLQGHSFGGYEVNVLVTKTNLFAAAAEAAGPTDFVSGYGAVLKAGNSNQFQFEAGQNRINATLWQKPDLYIKNSPIFYADKVNTPLLIMHCKEDDAVPFEQGVEWFTALRRLGKHVWMLQYDNGDHQLGGEDAKDYTIRLMQFFDHYLKGKPAPRWMIHGIPAKLKGIETGYE